MAHTWTVTHFKSRYSFGNVAVAVVHSGHVRWGERKWGYLSCLPNDFWEMHKCILIFAPMCQLHLPALPEDQEAKVCRETHCYSLFSEIDTRALIQPSSVCIWSPAPFKMSLNHQYWSIDLRTRWWKLIQQKQPAWGQSAKDDSWGFWLFEYKNTFFFEIS